MYQDFVADNFMQVDQRGALCLFIEHDESPLAAGGFLEAEGFLMCKYPSMKNESCMACKLKDGNDELIPYIGAEEFIKETHFIWYEDRKTPGEQGKVWKFDPASATRSTTSGVAETTTIPIPEWLIKVDHLSISTITYKKSVPDEYIEKQVDAGLAKLGSANRIQSQFRLKDMEPETDEAYNNPAIRFDLNADGSPKEFMFHGGVAQYGSATAQDPNYEGALKNPFWLRAHLGAIYPASGFWYDYYDDHKTPADDWVLHAWYYLVRFAESYEAYVYTIRCWRYMDRRLRTWRYVCIDVSPDLDFNSHGFHSETAKLKFNKLQLNSVAPAEDLDMDPLAYLKEQEEA